MSACWVSLHSLPPSLLRNEIIKRSTSLSWIWQRIRKHYNFIQSEVNFLSLANITRKPDERYEIFYQRIVAHLEDNLLTVASGLHHDGALPTDDEVMSPTTERLAVYLWLNLIDHRLPSYIARIYAHDLQSHTLKDIQPRLSQSMDSLLTEISTQEDIQVHYAKSSFRPNRAKLPNQTKTLSNHPASSKQCTLCKAAGRSHLAHGISSCWFLSKFEKMEIAKAITVTVDDIDQEDFQTTNNDNSVQRLLTTQPEYTIETPHPAVQKVACDVSPFFFAFYNHHPCHIVIDTGATSSVVSQSFIKNTGIPLKSTSHSVRSADKSRLPILGEVYFALNFRNIDLPMTALVLEKLNCDSLAGIPFSKANDIQVHLKSGFISNEDARIPYGAKQSITNQANVRRV